MCIHHHLISLHMLPITLWPLWFSTFVCIECVYLYVYHCNCSYFFTTSQCYQSATLSLSLALSPSRSLTLSIFVLIVGKILFSLLLFVFIVYACFWMHLCLVIWTCVCVCGDWIKEKCVGIKIHHVSYVWRFVIIWLVYLKIFFHFLLPLRPTWIKFMLTDDDADASIVQAHAESSSSSWTIIIFVFCNECASLKKQHSNNHSIATKYEIYWDHKHIYAYMFAHRPFDLIVQNGNVNFSVHS